jgi:hypothetical protein
MFVTLEALRPDRVRNQASDPIPTLDLQTQDAVKQWVELKQAYLALRGAKEGKNHKPVPRTTHHDVMQIATAWTRELRKVEPRNDHERTEHGRWKSCADQVAARYNKQTPGAEYPENERFWQECTARLAVYLEGRKIVPSSWELLVESVFEAIAEVPATIGRAGREVASGASSLLEQPGKLAAVLIGSVIVLPPLVRALLK